MTVAESLGVVYISGPMYGKPEFNHPAFNAVARVLRDTGYTVLNPAENDGGSANKSREFYLRLDMDHVLQADRLYVLPGWQESNGARLEVMVARALGLPIFDAHTFEEADLGIFNTGGKGDPRYHAELQVIADLHDRKQADYGGKTDPFANVRASEEWGVLPWVGAMIRLNDKVRRLQTLARKGALMNESAIDSFRDIAVYAIIAKILYVEGEGAVK